MGSFGVVIIEFGNFTSGLIASSIFLPSSTLCSRTNMIFSGE